jgi:hypothetical protein
MSTQAAGFDTALIEGYRQVSQRVLGPYQTAIVRIGIAATSLGLLLREWPHRHELYGPAGAFDHDLATRRVESNGAFTVIVWSDGALWFEACYAFAILASVAMLLGWRTRTASVMFMIGVLSVQNRNSFVGDGGDNLVHLLAIYLVATRCGQVWSLDSRRRRVRGGEESGDLVGVALWGVSGAVLVAATVLGKLTPGWALIFWGLLLAHAVWWVSRRRFGGQPEAVCDRIANLAHNGALMTIIVQVCLLYATAGWYKIQGGRWQDGTAVYYPMQIDDFTPWPMLSELLSSNALLILLLTYGTVIIQVAFPFTLLNRRVKNVLLVMLIAEHAGIAVLLGLPFFSLAVIAADLVFLPTNFLRWLERKACAPSRRRRTAGAEADDEAGAEPDRALAAAPR